MTRRPLILQLVYCPKEDKEHRNAIDGKMFVINFIDVVTIYFPINALYISLVVFLTNLTLN